MEDSGLDSGCPHLKFGVPSKIACGFSFGAVLSDVPHPSPGNAETDDSSEVPTRLYVWGSNKHQAIGLSDADSTYLAKPSNRLSIPFDTDAYIHEVSCGSRHMCILEKQPEVEGGRLYACGQRGNGRLGSAEAERIEREAELNGSQTFGGSGLVEVCISEKVARVSCGADHSLALTEHGQVYAWGLGHYGNLGHRGTYDAWIPCIVGGALEDQFVVDIAAGSKHSLALSENGIYSWGHGSHGRLGLGHYNAALSPEEVILDAILPSKVKAVYAGEAHSACIDDLRRVYTWGAGSFGRLGHGEEADQPSPRRVESMSGILCVEVALGLNQTIARTAQGKLMGWGQGLSVGILPKRKVSTLVPTPRPITHPKLQENPCIQICASAYSTMALLEGGEILIWGSGTSGRLGFSTHEHEPHPRLLQAIHGWTRKPWEHSRPNFKTPALVDEMITTDSPNTHMALPAKHDDNHSVASGRSGRPLPRAALPNSSNSNAINTDMVILEEENTESWNLKSIHCGSMFSVGLTGDGSVYSWGAADSGQTGLGSTEDIMLPRRVFGFSKPVRMLAVGSAHCLAILEETGQVVSWGCGKMGQLGNGRTRDQYEPTLVGTLVNPALHCAAGEDHSVVVLVSGETLSWGNAKGGKLGHGSSMAGGNQTLPRTVKLQVNIVMAACGVSHTALISAKGQIYSMGSGWFGKLGQGSNTNVYAPALVETSFSSRSIHCGANCTLAVSKDDQLYICGQDQIVCEENHQYTFKLFDKFLDGSLRVSKVAACESHVLVVTTDGRLWAWGQNDSGKLGVGRPGGRVSWPERVKNVRNVVNVATGPKHSFAVCNEAHNSTALYSFGACTLGRLGIESVGQAIAKKYIDIPESTPGPWEVHKESNSKLGGIDHGSLDEDGMGHDQNKENENKMLTGTLSISAVQQQLRNEKPEHKVEVLVEKERELKKEYSTFMREILTLWDKEAPLRKLESDLDGSLCDVLRHIGNIESPDLTTLPIHPEFSFQLRNYEELLWVLQQQPCYLANLAQVIDENDSDESKIYTETVKGIFHRVNDSRTRILFRSLLRLLTKEEVAKAKKPEHVFADRNSLFTPIMQFFCMSKYFQPSLRSFFDKSDATSFYSKMCERCLGLGIRSDLVFALDEQELAGLEPALASNKADLRANLAENVRSLHACIIEDFLPGLEKMKMPDDIKSLLKCLYTALRDQNFVAPDLATKILIPIRQVVMTCFLSPLLTDIENNAPRDCGVFEVTPERCKKKMLRNVKTIGRFIHLSATDGWAPTQLEHSSLGQRIRDSISRWISEVLRDATDRTEVELTVNLFTSHYNLSGQSCRTISMSTSQLTKLSNMILKYINSVRLSSSKDEVHRLVSSIGQWNPEMVAISEQTDLFHNFTMKSRFLFNHPEGIHLCERSQVPVPLHLANQDDLSHDEDAGYVKKYKPKVGWQPSPPEPIPPYQLLEALLAELPDVRSRDFLTMQYEFEEFSKKYLEMCQNQNNPDYDKVNKIEAAKKVLARLRQSGEPPEALGNFVSDALRSRRAHHTYLQQVHHGIEVIHQAQLEYNKTFDKTVAELTQSVKASQDCVVQPALRSRGLDHNVKPRLLPVEAKKRKQRSSMQGRQLPASWQPKAKATYSLGFLRSKRIVASVGPDVSQSIWRNLSFVFSEKERGDWNVVIVHRHHGVNHTLKTFTIDRTTSLPVRPQQQPTTYQPYNYSNRGAFSISPSPQAAQPHTPSLQHPSVANNAYAYTRSNEIAAPRRHTVSAQQFTSVRHGHGVQQLPLPAQVPQQQSPQLVSRIIPQSPVQAQSGLVYGYASSEETSPNPYVASPQHNFIHEQRKIQSTGGLASRVEQMVHRRDLNPVTTIMSKPDPSTYNSSNIRFTPVSHGKAVRTSDDWQFDENEGLSSRRKEVPLAGTRTDSAQQGRSSSSSPEPQFGFLPPSARPWNIGPIKDKFTYIDKCDAMSQLHRCAEQYPVPTSWPHRSAFIKEVCGLLRDGEHVSIVRSTLYLFTKLLGLHKWSPHMIENHDVVNGVIIYLHHDNIDVKTQTWKCLFEFVKSVLKLEDPTNEFISLLHMLTSKLHDVDEISFSNSSHQFDGVSPPLPLSFNRRRSSSPMFEFSDASSFCEKVFDIIIASLLLSRKTKRISIQPQSDTVFLRDILRAVDKTYRDQVALEDEKEFLTNSLYTKLAAVLKLLRLNIGSRFEGCAESIVDRNLLNKLGDILKSTLVPVLGVAASVIGETQNLCDFTGPVDYSEFEQKLIQKKRRSISRSVSRDNSVERRSLDRGSVSRSSSRSAERDTSNPFASRHRVRHSVKAGAPPPKIQVTEVSSISADRQSESSKRESLGTPAVRPKEKLQERDADMTDSYKPRYTQDTELSRDTPESTTELKILQRVEDVEQRRERRSTRDRYNRDIDMSHGPKPYHIREPEVEEVPKRNVRQLPRYLLDENEKQSPRESLSTMLPPRKKIAVPNSAGASTTASINTHRSAKLEVTEKSQPSTRRVSPAPKLSAATQRRLNARSRTPISSLPQQQERQQPAPQESINTASPYSANRVEEKPAPVFSYSSNLYSDPSDGTSRTGTVERRSNASDDRLQYQREPRIDSGRRQESRTDSGLHGERKPISRHVVQHEEMTESRGHQERKPLSSRTRYGNVQIEESNASSARRDDAPTSSRNRVLSARARLTDRSTNSNTEERKEQVSSARRHIPPKPKPSSTTATANRKVPSRRLDRPKTNSRTPSANGRVESSSHDVPRSGRRAVDVGMTYVEDHELQPLTTAQLPAGRTLSKLVKFLQPVAKDEEWLRKFDAMNVVRQITKFHSHDIINSQVCLELMATVIDHLCTHTDSPRSGISKNSMIALAAIFREICPPGGQGARTYFRHIRISTRTTTPICT